MIAIFIIPEKMSIKNWFCSTKLITIPVIDRFRPVEILRNLICPKNLLKNGGFESDLRYWIVQKDPYVNLSCHPHAAHTGNYGLLVEAGRKGRFRIMQQFIELTPGKKVSLSAYIYLPTDIPYFLTMILYCYDLSGYLVGSISEMFYFSNLEKNRWVQLKVTGDVPSSTYDADVVIVSDVKGLYYLDDISLYEEEEGCIEGQTRCDPANPYVLQKCIDGKWQGWESCIYGCEELYPPGNARCRPKP